MPPIVLTGEPLSTQHIYRIAGNRLYMTETAKRRKRDYYYEARSQYRGLLMRGDITLSLRVYFKNNRRVDCDNFNKLVLDALTGVIYADDSQIRSLHIFFGVDREKPRVEITVN